MTGDDRIDHAQTKYLRLPLYTDDTPMDLRDGYDEAMRILDRKIHQMEILIRESKGRNE